MKEKIDASWFGLFIFACILSAVAGVIPTNMVMQFVGGFGITGILVWLVWSVSMFLLFFKSDFW